MAIVETSKVSEHNYSFSQLISKFRSKKRFVAKLRPRTQRQDGVLQDARSSLVQTPLPLVLPEHQETLSAYGWTTITFPKASLERSRSSETPTLGPHPLQQAYEALFAASQIFFNQEDHVKQRWKHKLGSEEGWSKIPGEKEFITLRSQEYCPDVLREPAKRYWDLMGAHLSNSLGRISTTLGLPDDEDDGLRRFVGSCGVMQSTDEAKTATMLRLFRYEGWEAKEVAEPHADLGLLSVVVGNVPGLEVWDGLTWFECEKEVVKAGQQGATMLAGRQLERLTNGRYPAGGHRVVSYGSAKDSTESATADKHYRFSIVFVLRAHEPVIINSDDFETGITGPWQKPIRDVAAGNFYADIRAKHFNINVAMSEREKQRRKVKLAKGGEQASSG